MEDKEEAKEVGEKGREKRIEDRRRKRVRGQGSKSNLEFGL